MLNQKKVALHFPACFDAPKRGFPKPGSGQTWVSAALRTVGPISHVSGPEIVF